MPGANVRIPGRGEKAISYCVIALLAVVSVGVAIQQARFNPAVLVATAPGPAPIPSVPARGLVDPWPAGLSTMEAAETFTADTLSDKIDGKADLYLSAGFVALESQRVELGPDRNSWLEMFVFDMGRPANAFSVYSSQRRPGARDVDIADLGYEAGNELCLVDGRYYVELVGSDSRDPTLRAAEAAARAFAAATPVTEHADTAAAEALFPPQGRIPGSLVLISSDVFGFDRLKNVFVARYRDGKGDVTLFVSKRGGRAEAASAAADLRGFFVDECGGREMGAPGAPPGASLIDLGGRFDAVFASGPFLAGVHQAASRESAQHWLEALGRHIGAGNP